MIKKVQFLLLGLGLTLFSATSSALEVGDVAPNFSLPGSDGKTYQLANYHGKQAVVLAWFPKAYTSGCTIECLSLAENGDKIREFDVSYFMASTDPLEENKGFALETGADFPLLSDEDKSVAKAYEVLSFMGFAKRHTIYIDKNGKIIKIDKNINPDTSAEDMIENLDALGIKKHLKLNQVL